MALVVGFIGIGNMGFPMAGNVRKKMPAPAVLLIYDLNRKACENFVQQYQEFGPIEIASSPKDLTNRSVTVITMVPMDAHVQAVYLDKDTGVIAAGQNPDRQILECSTVNISTTREIGQKIIDARIGSYIDAPVSGGVKGAEAGTLSFFLGHSGSNDQKPYAQDVKDIVGWMGAADRINFCGSLGNGLVCKIVNNYIALTNIAVAAEGMAFGQRFGVNMSTLHKCIQGSSGDSWALNFSNPVPGLVPNSASSNEYKAGFTSKLCAKDINLAINAAHQVGVEPTLGEASVKHFEKADQDSRTTGLDGSAIWLHIAEEVDKWSSDKS